MYIKSSEPVDLDTLHQKALISILNFAEHCFSFQNDCSTGIELLSRVMRKPVFAYICENKGPDQLQGNSSQIQNFKPLDMFCGCTTRFLSDLDGNPKDRFSHYVAHFYQFWNSFTLHRGLSKHTTLKYL